MPASYVSLPMLAAAIAAHRLAIGPEARVAFVLAPGGAAGAYQAGALLALAEHAIIPDLLVGTSSGALNALGFLLDTLDPLSHGPWPASRLGHMWRKISHRQRGAALVVDKPHAIGWISGRPSWRVGVAAEVLTDLPRLASNTGPDAGIFGWQKLRAMLTSAVNATLHRDPKDPTSPGQALVTAWSARHAAGFPVPTLVILASDPRRHAAVPFVLGDPEVTRRLHVHRYPVRALGHGRLAGDRVIEAFLASAAIPGVFAPVSLPDEDPPGIMRRHVDGAVAASEPFHIAIDAGATLLVSLEVMPMRRALREAGDDPDGDRHPIAMAADSLMAIQERYLRADARGVASWNIRLHSDHAIGRRKVPFYRLAPARQELGLLDFDGHYEHGKLVTSVFDWTMRGYADAGGCNNAAWVAYERGRERHGDTGCALTGGHEPGFWDATRQSMPGARSHGLPPAPAVT